MTLVEGRRSLPTYRSTYPATLDGLHAACHRKAAAEDDPKVPAVVPTSSAIAELIDRLMACEEAIDELAGRR